MNIYVSNFGDAVTDDALLAAFNRHGTVTSAKVIKDRFSGYSKGFGFVEMPDESEAKKAMTLLNGSVLNGQKISVKEAKPRPTSDNAYLPHSRTSVRY